MDLTDNEIVTALTFARGEFDSIFSILGDLKFALGGGAVTRALYRYFHQEDFEDVKDVSTYYQDIDIFSDGTKSFNDICEKLKHAPGVKVVKVKSSGDECPYYVRVCKFVQEDKHFDVIESEPTAEQALLMFDILPCAVMIADQHGYALDGAIKCIQQKEIVLNGFHKLASTLLRIVKYTRRGFKVTPIAMLDLEGVPNGYTSPNGNFWRFGDFHIQSYLLTPADSVERVVPVSHKLSYRFMDI